MQSHNGKARKEDRVRSQATQEKKAKKTDQNAIAGKEGKLKLHANQLRSPLLNIFPTTPPFFLPN
jgi:hypothetical protein